jgi:hypothetical protein
MGQSPTPLAPLEAARLIADVERAGDAATARTAGTIGMLWGLLLPAMVFTVTAFDFFLTDISPLLSGFSWLPFAVGGTVLTVLLARDRAVKLGLPFRSAAFWIALAAAPVLLLATAGLFALLPDLQLGSYPLMAVVAGCYLAARGAYLLRQPWGRQPWTLVLGLLLVASAVVMESVGLGAGDAGEPAALAAGLAIGIAYFANGVLLYRRG